MGDCTLYVIGWTIHTIYMSESVLLFHRICTFLFESLLKQYAMSSPRSKLIAHISIPVYFSHVYNMYRTIIRSMVATTLSYPLSPITRPSSDEYKKYLSSPHFPPPPPPPRGISSSPQSSFLHYFYDRVYFNFLYDSIILLAFPPTMMVSSVKNYHSCSSMRSATLSKQYRYYTIRAYSLTSVLVYLGPIRFKLYISIAF